MLLLMGMTQGIAETLHAQSQALLHKFEGCAYVARLCWHRRAIYQLILQHLLSDESSQTLQSEVTSHLYCDMRQSLCTC